MEGWGVVSWRGRVCHGGVRWVMDGWGGVCHGGVGVCHREVGWGGL